MGLFGLGFPDMVMEWLEAGVGGRGSAVGLLGCPLLTLSPLPPPPVCPLEAEAGDVLWDDDDVGLVAVAPLHLFSVNLFFAAKKRETSKTDNQGTAALFCAIESDHRFFCKI